MAVEYSDVLPHIFSFLGTPRDLVMAGYVCKAWNESSRSEELWESFYYQEWDPWHIYDHSVSNYRNAVKEREERFLLATSKESTYKLDWTRTFAGGGLYPQHLFFYRQQHLYILAANRESGDIVLNKIKASNGEWVDSVIIEQRPPSDQKPSWVVTKDKRCIAKMLNDGGYKIWDIDAQRWVAGKIRFSSGPVAPKPGEINPFFSYDIISATKIICKRPVDAYDATRVSCWNPVEEFEEWFMDIPNFHSENTPTKRLPWLVVGVSTRCVVLVSHTDQNPEEMLYRIVRISNGEEIQVREIPGRQPPSDRLQIATMFLSPDKILVCEHYFPDNGDPKEIIFLIDARTGRCLCSEIVVPLTPSSEPAAVRLGLWPKSNECAVGPVFIAEDHLRGGPVKTRLGVGVVIPINLDAFRYQTESMNYAHNSWTKDALVVELKNFDAFNAFSFAFDENFDVYVSLGETVAKYVWSMDAATVYLPIPLSFFESRQQKAK
eukprot:TRINITY_DN2401_c0_g1_i1.p1 TRINITY_DN2401_c0_g1~~TRINITY_DN2401_c0_g1_i1.p1  ORF type:complete len:491 (+),score=82.30 TRINITY_DN2401_c0_g1_i1:163-1635(+)